MLDARPRPFISTRRAAARNPRYLGPTGRRRVAMTFHPVGKLPSGHNTRAVQCDKPLRRICWPPEASYATIRSWSPFRPTTRRCSITSMRDPESARMEHAPSAERPILARVLRNLRVGIRGGFLCVTRRRPISKMVTNRRRRCWTLLVGHTCAARLQSLAVARDTRPG